MFYIRYKNKDGKSLHRVQVPELNVEHLIERMKKDLRTAYEIKPNKYTVYIENKNEETLYFVSINEKKEISYGAAL